MPSQAVTQIQKDKCQNSLLFMDPSSEHMSIYPNVSEEARKAERDHGREGGQEALEREAGGGKSYKRV